MADDKATATFTLNLDGNAISTAEDTAKSLEQLQTAIEADEQALKGFQATLRRLRGDGAASTQTIQDLTARIKAQKAAIGAKAAQQLKLGGVDGVGALAGKAKDKFSRKDVINEFLPRINSAKKLISLAAKYKYAFAAAAVAAGAIMVVAATAAFAAIAAKMGFMAANERRDEALRLEGLARYRNYWAELLGFVRKADSGSTLLKIVDRVTDATAASREEVSGLVDEFYKAGFRGKTLQDVIEGASIALTTQGRAGVEQFKAMATTARLFGNSASGVAAQWKKRLGDIAQRQMLSFGVQVRKLRENLTRLFSGVRIEGFLKLFAKLVSMFSATTLQGQQLQRILAALFNPISDWIGGNEDLIPNFFDGAINAGLKFILFCLDIRDAFKSVFGKNHFGGLITLRDALELGKIAAYGFAAALAVVGALIGIQLAIYYGIAKAVMFLVDAFKSAYDFIAGIKWDGLGSRIVDGITAGMREKWDSAATAIRTMMSKLVNAGKFGLQIQSPSKLFRYQGRMISAGVAAGVNAGAPEAEAAVSAMTARLAPATEAETPRRSGSEESGSAGKAKSSLQQSITFGDIIINGAPGDADEDWSRKIRNEVIGLLQNAGLQMGAA